MTTTRTLRARAATALTAPYAASWEAPLPGGPMPVPAQARARVTATTPRLHRWYMRCGDCLAVCVVEGLASPAPADCGACDGAGTVGCLGRVVTARAWERLELRPPCDGRCTEARGPACDCQCGGENHGSGRLVECVAEAGRTPRVTARDPGAAQRAAEHRAARDEARNRVRAVTAGYAPGDWLPPSTWERARDARRALARAESLLTHSGRLRALAAVAAPAPAPHDAGCVAGCEEGAP